MESQLEALQARVGDLQAFDPNRDYAAEGDEVCTAWLAFEVGQGEKYYCKDSR